MNDKTIDDRCADPVFYGLELAGDLLLKSRHYQNPDYWQQALVAMHSTLVEMFLLDEFGFRYRSAIEKQAIKDYLTGQLANFDPPKVEIPPPEKHGDDYHFGACPTCHKSDGYFSIQRNDYGRCDAHQVVWPVGYNVFSYGQSENEETRTENERKFKEYSKTK